MKYYEIFLPMPTSVNATKTVSAGFRNKETNKWTRIAARSKEYSDWIEAAGHEWRRQFPKGIAKQFSGRIGVVYVFVWPINDIKEAGIKSDIGNREKALSDFVKGKFFEDDKMIDEQKQFRRLWGNKRPYVWARIYEIPDNRYTDPALLFSKQG